MLELNFLQNILHGQTNGIWWYLRVNSGLIFEFRLFFRTKKNGIAMVLMGGIHIGETLERNHGFLVRGDLVEVPLWHGQRYPASIDSLWYLLKAEWILTLIWKCLNPISFHFFTNIAAFISNSNKIMLQFMFHPLPNNGLSIKNRFAWMACKKSRPKYHWKCLVYPCKRCLWKFPPIWYSYST